MYCNEFDTNVSVSRSVYCLIIIIIIIPISPNAGIQFLQLVASSDQPCFDTVLTLTCNHPDVTSPQFLDSGPSWTEDNYIFTPTRPIFSSSMLSRTTSILNISLTRTHFQEKGHTYQCFLRVHGGRAASNNITVDPLSELQKLSHCISLN